MNFFPCSACVRMYALQLEVFVSSAICGAEADFPFERGQNRKDSLTQKRKMSKRLKQQSKFTRNAHTETRE